ncbi:kinesin-like protein klp-19 [Parasteatoda tepidariorum]|uniref:kinesin-like protein klp-19 n=1 Tax=Parasteatoda tepidariorum TaxID=114398 RepID=UPI00077F90B0|nr:chromosome-associated kinesin KIF4 [Parasteatoda tepidariorum]XP_015930615.1 chromosome-associated kinesin KIF4 [Parasteatoda tepidariorum]
MTEAAIKVAIRVRPPLLGESMNEDIDLNQQGTAIEIRNASFSFDIVFPPETSNEDVYKGLVSEKIQHLFEGFNVTILAYGSTGSGKTFTMGTASIPQDEDSKGLVPRGLQQIFEHTHSISQDTSVVINASFFEIYMETVKDLLKNQSTYIPGDSKEAKISSMTQINVKSYSEAMQALRRGTLSRTTAVTSKNARSSRSHAFFLISMIMTNKKDGKSKYAKFLFVDLAGSERAGVDSSEKEFKQGVQINKGLTALGRVISSLSTREKHIPYRDSLLTRFLQDSFGGSSYTVMVTCVSPAQSTLEETLSSLRYSACAKKIKNNVVINKDSTDLIEHLKLELGRVKKLGLEEKEKLMNQINSLNDRLKMAQDNSKMMKEKLMDFTTSIQSLEEMMSSSTFEKSLLQICLDIVGNIKKDLNSLIELHNLGAERDLELIRYEEKCKEAEDLKKKLTDAEEKIQQLRSTTTTSATRRIRSQPQCSHDSMMEEFINLSEDEASFAQQSELQDPDFRGTPMYKRKQSKAKRKNPEGLEPLTSPKPPKTLSTGCSCPGDCSSIRCSCKKKKQTCTPLCDCVNCENL